MLTYSTAILDQVNLFLRTLMRILRFLRNTPQKKETVVRPILLVLIGEQGVRRRIGGGLDKGRKEGH